MKVLKNCFAFYINSSIHVALAVTALSAITALHFEFQIDWELLLFIFFGAITGYNFIKFAGIAKLHHRSLAKSLKVIQVFSFLCFVALIYFALQLSLSVIVVAGFFGLLTMLYALPIFAGSRNLRTIKGMKVHIISIVWTGVSVLCPVIEAGITLDTDVFLEIIQRYFLVLILLLPFDIRDLKHDSSQLGTIPQRIGTRKTQILGLILLIPFIGAGIFKETATSSSLAAVVVTAAVTGCVVLRAREEQSSYFSSFWVEGVPVVWLGILWALRDLF